MNLDSVPNPWVMEQMEQDIRKDQYEEREMRYFSVVGNDYKYKDDEPVLDDIDLDDLDDLDDSDLDDDDGDEGDDWDDLDGDDDDDENL